MIPRYINIVKFFGMPNVTEKMSFPIILLGLVAFLDLLGVGLIVPLIPSHVRQMGGNHIYIGLQGSIYAGFQFASGPLIGSLSDLKGRKPVLILTLLVCSCAYMVLSCTNSITTILCVRAVLGFFRQTQLLTKALVPDYEKDEKQQSAIYGKMAAIVGVGITLGPVIGGHVVEDYPTNGFSYIAFAIGGIFIIMAVLTYLLPKTTEVKKNPSKPKGEISQSLILSILDSTKRSFGELSKVQWSKYWVIFLFQALNNFAMVVFFSNYVLYLKTQYGLSPKYIGYVGTVQGITEIVTSYRMGYINSFYSHDKDYSIRNYHVFFILSLALLGICLSFNVLMYSMLLIPLAIGNAVGRLVTLEMVLKKSQGDHRGTLIGSSNSVRSFMGVISPMVAGLIGEFFGVTNVFYASLFSSVIGLIMSYQYKNKHFKVD